MTDKYTGDQKQRELAEEAAKRYNNNRATMENIKSMIDHNRKGDLSLIDITNDEDRKKKRIARAESTSNGKSPLERVNGVPDFQDINIVKRILSLSDAVGRIIIGSEYGSSGYGTGFMVSPSLMLTNNHVLPDPGSASNSRIQFRYEIHPDGSKSDPVEFRLRPDQFYFTSAYTKSPAVPGSGLDFTLVAVEPVSDNGFDIADIGFAQLDGETGKILEGENCVIIQHPKGDYKKIVLKDIRMISLVDDFIVYESDTLPGSSGSMVLGLGTGEVVALHHSAIPRMDDKGNWLRKDGKIVGPADADDQIDWIGNEGVRISRIVRLIRESDFSGSMNEMRNQFLNSIKNIGMGQPITLVTTSASTAAAPPDSSKSKPQSAPAESANESYFEVQLVNNQALEEDWETNAATMVPGFVSMEKVFGAFSDKTDPKFYYLTARSADNPWVTAELIENFPHVAYCAPDEPIPTDAMLWDEHGNQQAPGRFESAAYNRGIGERNEDDFLKKWKDTELISALYNSDNKKLIRFWNQHAVNFIDGIDGYFKSKYKSARTSEKHRDTLAEKLRSLKMVQLDTGYSNLSKIDNGIDFVMDYDFVDTDNRAQDELRKVGMKHPYHGTRTASLVVGGNLKNDTEGMDGNSGILTRKEEDRFIPMVKLIPYRVANSVVLINRGKNILDAVNRAITISADVMFMCMGTLPSPVFDKAARTAYENGLIWVCAAGNEVECIVAPASYPGTIAVAAINPAKKVWSGSSYGEMVDIAAPGEDVYVPFINKKRDEIMVYGDGTSYATPHVASAAMLWKAKNYDRIRELYKKPWQVVEAFRWSLKHSANTEPFEGKTWNTSEFGDGILDITALLDLELPDPDILSNAYEDQDWPAIASSSVTQACRTLWQFLTRKINPWEPAPFESSYGMTDNGKRALEALQRSVTPTGPGGKLESAMVNKEDMALEALREYMEQYERNKPA